MAGRGGAGNIEATNRKISTDLEASQAAAEDGTNTSPIAQALRSDRSEATVAYSGRGGAGNAYNPAELAQKGQSSLNRSDDTERLEPSEKNQAVHMRGRGGAGNYVTPAVERKEVELLPKNGQNKAPGPSQIEQHVERELPKPQSAYLGPKGKEREPR